MHSSEDETEMKYSRARFANLVALAAHAGLPVSKAGLDILAEEKGIVIDRNRVRLAGLIELAVDAGFPVPECGLQLLREERNNRAMLLERHGRHGCGLAIDLTGCDV